MYYCVYKMEREIFDAWIAQIHTVRRSIPNYTYMITADTRACLLSAEQQEELRKAIVGLIEDLDSVRIRISGTVDTDTPMLS